MSPPLKYPSLRSPTDFNESFFNHGERPCPPPETVSNTAKYPFTTQRMGSDKQRVQSIRRSKKEAEQRAAKTPSHGSRSSRSLNLFGNLSEHAKLMCQSERGGGHGNICHGWGSDCRRGFRLDLVMWLLSLQLYRVLSPSPTPSREDRTNKRSEQRNEKRQQNPFLGTSKGPGFAKKFSFPRWYPLIVDGMKYPRLLSVGGF